MPPETSVGPSRPAGLSRAERMAILQRTSHPPRVAIGDIVFFYPDASRSATPVPAIVTAIGEETLCMAVILKDAMSLQPFDGVRHLDDPKLSAQESVVSGAWDYTPLLRGIYAMLQKD